jgi:2,3-bisphosphoglycerate-dependent phosphoglycerate mutase
MTMKKRLHLYVFRHGQTYFNRDDKFTGFIDSKLTGTGFEEAKIIALRLKDKRIGVAFHTSQSRTKETLKEVLKFHPECRQIIEDNRMIERDYGKLSGLTHLECVKKYGPEQYDKWHRGFNDRPPGGESFADIEKRVKSFINDLIKFMKEAKVNAAVSASGNSIRLFRKIMEKAPVERVVEWFIPYDKVYEYIIYA